LIGFNGKMNNMNGIYRVYEDGILIAEQKNKLTVLGRANALKAMLGSTQSFASSMGIGVDGSANDTSTFHSKTDLGFNVGKYPVVSSSLGNTETYDALVYTARITDQSRYNITELGLFANRVVSGVHCYINRYNIYTNFLCNTTNNEGNS
jgi:hypothetical protein